MRRRNALKSGATRGRGFKLRWINCRSAALAVAACTLACVPEVQAQERPLSVSLGYGVTWDDNVFRLPEGAPDPQASRGIAGKSDRSSTASVGLHVNLPLSMQRILLEIGRA